MALATFHSKRGEKSALILVKANKFVFQARPCYVPLKAVEGKAEGEEFQIPDGFTFVPMTNDDGTSRTADSGEPLCMLQY